MGRHFQEIAERRRRERQARLAPIFSLLRNADPGDRALLLLWLCKYFADSGDRFSPQLFRERQRIVINGDHYWLVRVPRRIAEGGTRRTLGDLGRENAERTSRGS